MKKEYDSEKLLQDVKVVITRHLKGVQIETFCEAIHGLIEDLEMQFEAAHADLRRQQKGK